MFNEQDISDEFLDKTPDYEGPIGTGSRKHEKIKEKVRQALTSVQIANEPNTLVNQAPEPEEDHGLHESLQLVFFAEGKDVDEQQDARWSKAERTSQTTSPSTHHTSQPWDSEGF